MTVYFTGILFDLRGHAPALVVEGAVLVAVGLVFLFTVFWWNPSGGRATPPRSRVFLVLAVLALAVQAMAVVVESADTNALSNNAANLLLLVILLVNTLG
jgi:hypothetical protein